MNLTADDLIRLLELKPHPEGGHFREAFRDEAPAGGRAASTAIYYLLKAGEHSHWHRIDAVEVWHYYAGDPLELSLSPDGKQTEYFHLGTDFINGERPQIIIPAGAWQAAKPLGDWTLVGCTVAPGFDFKNFEMAPPGWTPGG